MNKQELVEAISQKATTVKKSDITAVVEGFTSVVGEELAKGNKVQLLGFGSFESKARKERTGRNPKNPSESIVIPASNAPVFKAGKALKEMVNK